MKSVIFGAGTYGEVYLAYLQEAGVEVVGFIDDNENLWGKEIGGVKILGGKDLLPQLFAMNDAQAIYCPIGNNKFRVKILTYAEELGYKTPNFIHKSVIVSPNVTIGKGVYILPNGCIMPHTTIEDYVMMSVGVNVAHHTKLCKGVFLAAGVNVGASMKLCEYVYAGTSSTFVIGIKTIGSNALIGAGAVVLKDVEENAVMAGVPAKLLRIKES
ncbi:MAG: acetyltransferase [Phocaeicola sp.]